MLDLTLPLKSKAADCLAAYRLNTFIKDGKVSLKSAIAVSLVRCKVFDLKDFGFDVEASSVDVEYEVDGKTVVVSNPSYDHLSDDLEGLFLKWVWARALSVYNTSLTNNVRLNPNGVEPYVVQDTELSQSTVEDFLQGAGSESRMKVKSELMALLSFTLAKMFGSEAEPTLRKALNAEGSYGLLDASTREAATLGLEETIKLAQGLVLKAEDGEELSEGEEVLAEAWPPVDSLAHQLLAKLQSVKPIQTFTKSSITL